MKKILIVLLFLCPISSVVFGTIPEGRVNESKSEKVKKIAIFGNLGFAIKMNSFGLRNIFIQAGAQFKINDAFFAEFLLNYYFSSSATHSIYKSTSFGIGMAGVYKIKMDQGFLIDLKAGILIHNNPAMKTSSYPFTFYTSARTDFGIQFGPDIEYMFSPGFGLRAGATYNILFANNTPMWFGLTGGIICKL